MTTTSTMPASKKTTVMDGSTTAIEILSVVRQKMDYLKSQHGVIPGLAVVLVGDDPASHVYVNKKMAMTSDVGIRSTQRILPADVNEDTLIDCINDLNQDDTVHGILVQLPLPKHIDAEKILNLVQQNKDVDGFNAINAGRLLRGLPTTIPCTPLGCLILLNKYIGNISGKIAVILGRSNIVGKPMGQLLLQSDCTVIQAHSHTKNLVDICRLADILVVAVGHAELVDDSWLKDGCVVLDVGINAIHTKTEESKTSKRKLVGDVNFLSASKKASAMTPVPGGVGPMTIACLMSNCVRCTYLSLQLSTDEIDNLSHLWGAS